MAVRIRDNADQFLKEYDKLVPVRKRHTLDLINNMEYAETLHNRHGYYVFNDEHMLETAAQWIRELIESGQPLSVQTIEDALDGAGFEEINFLRSYTNEMRPPVRAGQGPRRAHPGGWSDVTNNLRNAYHHKVNGKRGKTA